MSDATDMMPTEELANGVIDAISPYILYCLTELPQSRESVEKYIDALSVAIGSGMMKGIGLYKSVENEANGNGEKNWIDDENIKYPDMEEQDMLNLFMLCLCKKISERHPNR